MDKELELRLVGVLERLEAFLNNIPSSTKVVRSASQERSGEQPAENIISPGPLFKNGSVGSSPSSPIKNYMCEECQVPITLAEKEYSEKWYNKALYRKRKEKVESATGPKDVLW